MDYLDLDTLTMAGKYLLGATGGLVSYVAGNYLIGFALEFDKEAISDGCRSDNTRYRWWVFEF
jgi:hypothetical protein